ncbi:ribulose-phosphate 3-epimerase [Oscillospiraceae bacterium OttesenSCG-928-F05]|nr:ribulose-phosphate 3-epimerase [Oscillospiraceae bacterium OttesenSCG-928-F05]
MCLRMDNLAKEITELENSGVDRFHLDLMDGVFVPNYSLGMQDIEAVCRLSGKKTELHLMTVDPGKYIQRFADLGVDIIYIHPDADYHPSTVLQQIGESGAKPGIVLSPGTSIESVKDLLHIAEYVLVMSVNPGHAGQNFLPYVGEKISQLIALKKEYGFELGLDGGCSSQMIEKYYPMGVDSFVLGTAALMNAKYAYADAITRLRAVTGDAVKTEKAAPIIKILAMDVDGTLTDGKIYMGAEGEVLKAFDIKDGYSLHEMLPMHHIKPVWITGRESEIVTNRAKELGVDLVYQNVKNKLDCLHEMLEEQGCTMAETAFMGDDVADAACLSACGFSGCPGDAAKEVKAVCDFVSDKKAGEGAARDFIYRIVERNEKSRGNAR